MFCRFLLGPAYGLSWPDGFNLWHVFLELSGIPKLWISSMLIWKGCWYFLLANHALALCWHPTLEHGAWHRAWCPLLGFLASATLCHVCLSMKTKMCLNETDVKMIAIILWQQVPQMQQKQQQCRRVLKKLGSTAQIYTLLFMTGHGKPGKHTKMII